MKRAITRITLALIAANFIAVDVFAASGAGHTPSISDLKYPAINFTLFCALIYFLTHKAIRKQMQARRQGYSDQIQAGARALAKAQSEMDEAQKKVSNFDAEVQNLEQRVRTEAKQEAATIVVDAKEQSERILSLGKETALAEKQSGQTALHQEVVELAMQKATESLKANSSVSSDKAIRDNALKSVSAIGSN